MSDNNFSTINLPITLSIAAIEQVINNRLLGILYEDKSFENNDGDSLKVKVEKDGEIKISMASQNVAYQVPLKLEIIKTIGISNLRATGEIIIDFSTSYEIKKDWRLATQTEVVTHTWVKKPVLHLGPVKIPIKKIGNRALKRSESIIEKAIDNALQSQFDLRKLVTEVWYQLQQPIEVSREYNFWLSIEPEKLGMIELSADEHFIKGRVIIQARPKSVIGEKPAPHSSVLLPPFLLSNDENEEFSLNLSAFIPFQEAEIIAVKHLVGETFSTGNKSVRIEELKLSGLQDKLFIEARLKGTYNGNVQLSGKPVYNIQTNELELERLEYEISTKNILMQSANWLFKKEIEKRLKKELRFPLSHNLEKLEKIVESELKNLEISPNVFLQGDLHSIKVEHTHLETDGIRVNLSTSGKLNLLLEGFLRED